MRNRLILLGWLQLILSVASPAQPPVEGPRHILELLGNRIMAETSYRFIDTTNRTMMVTNPPRPVVPSVRILSDYNDWNYFMGVVLSGMMRTAEATNQSKYREYVLKNFAFIFNHLDYFRDQWEIQQIPRASFYRVFRMNMLDDCGAMGSALAEAYQAERDPRYLRMLQRIGNYIRKVQLRLADGTLARPDPRYMTLWADDLYMSVPFLVRMAEIANDPRYSEDAISQVMGFAKRLVDPGTGLLKHAWFSDSVERSVAAWGRANGWAVMAQVELLSHLLPSHSLKDSLLGTLRRHLTAIARYQSEGGLWHQVLDRPDSYLETSCSAMFCYGLARAVNRGWLDQSFAQHARRAWRSIASRVRPDGQIEGICRGTEVGFTMQYYFERPTPLNDTRGIGAVLLAGAEMIWLEGDVCRGDSSKATESK